MDKVFHNWFQKEVHWWFAWEKTQATDNCVLEGNLQYKLTILKVFVLARAWKYLEWGGNSFAVRYTGHKLSVVDIQCTAS